jgi:membrane protein required for colicin V production
MATFSILDWLIVLVVLLNVVEAISQGLLYEVFSFAGVIAGYLIAAWEYPKVAVYYRQVLTSAWAADIAGFLTIFVLVTVLGSAIGGVARRAAEGIGLRWVDRFAGGAFGVFKGIVICTVVVIALATFSPASAWIRDSRIAPFMLAGGRSLIWAAPADVRQRFRDGWDLLRTVPAHLEHAGGR